MNNNLKTYRLPVVHYKEVVNKMRARYVNVSIPEELAKEIDRYVKKAKRGYRSRAEFLSDAARRILDGSNKNNVEIEMK